MDEAPTEIPSPSPASEAAEVENLMPKFEATEAGNGSAEEMVEELSSLLKRKRSCVRSGIRLFEMSELCVWCGRVYLEEFLDGWDLYYLDSCFPEQYHCTCSG